MAPGPSAAQGNLCPSGRCTDGALLIGLVAADGQVRYLGGPARIDDDFVAIAHRGRTPEARFRFAEPCAQRSCANWADDRCGLVGDLRTELAPVTTGSDLPACGIRARCVWFAQEGRDACAICPQVVHTSLQPTS